MTGAATERVLVEHLGRELVSAKRHGRPLALIVFDVGGLPQLAAERGVLTSEEALRRVVAAAREHLHRDEVLARLDWDRFAVALSPATVEEAAARAEELREAVAAAPLPPEAGEHHLTLALGVAADAGERTAAELLDAARAACDRAAAAGGDRVATET